MQRKLTFYDISRELWEWKIHFEVETQAEN